MQAEDGLEVLGILAKLNRTIDDQQNTISGLNASLSEKQQVIATLLQEREVKQDEQKPPVTP